MLGQHSVASQKRHSAQDSQVLEGLEHVELSPVDIHEAQHRSMSQVEDNCARSKCEVGDIGSNPDPQCKEQEQGREDEGRECIGHHCGGPLLRLSEQVLTREDTPRSFRLRPS